MSSQQSDHQHNYVYIRNLGRGSFGNVIVAEDRVTGEHVAIKLLQRERMTKHTIGEVLNHRWLSSKSSPNGSHPHVIGFKVGCGSRWWSCSFLMKFCRKLYMHANMQHAWRFNDYQSIENMAQLIYVSHLLIAGRVYNTWSCLHCYGICWCVKEGEVFVILNTMDMHQ